MADGGGGTPGSSGRKRAFVKQIKSIPATEIRSEVRSSTTRPSVDSSASAGFMQLDGVTRTASNADGQSSRKMSGTVSGTKVTNSTKRRGKSRKMSISVNFLGHDFEKQYKETLEEAAAEDTDIFDMVQIDEARDVVVSEAPRECRTVQSEVPRNVLGNAGTDVLMQHCIGYYTDGYHHVSRTSGKYAGSIAELTEPSADVPLDEFEVDLRDQKRVTTDATKPELQFDFPMGALHEGTLQIHKHYSAGAGARSSVHSLSKRKASVSESAIPALTKWKKYKTVLCFKTTSGPLELQMLLDQKKKSTSVVPDVVVLDNVVSIVMSSNPKLPESVFEIKLEDGTTVLCSSENKFDVQTWIETLNRQVTVYTQQQSKGVVASVGDGRTVEGCSLEAYREIERMLETNSESDERDRIRKRVARQDLSGVYKADDVLVPIKNKSLETPPVLSEDLGLQILVTCERLLFKLQFNLATEPYLKTLNPEAFYASLALFDVRNNVRLSENFSFDLNRPGEGAQPDVSLMDTETKARQAIFSVHAPHPDIYLVLVVEKVLQGDMTSCADVYSKSINPKAAEKQKGAAEQATQRLAGYRMPFAWSARPVLQQNNAVDTTATFKTLFRHDPERLREEDFIKLLGEFHAYRTGGPKAKFKQPVIPGEFDAKVSRYSDDGTPTVTHSFARVANAGAEADINTQIPRREVLSFPPPNKVVTSPHNSYTDYIYIRPMAVNFTVKKVNNSSARNVSCTVQIVKSDGSPVGTQPAGLPLIFGKSSEAKMRTSAVTAVSYHNKTPGFYEEVKIKLPVDLSQQHHILFTFHHVTVEQKKGKEMATPIGYAWLPLVTSDKSLLEDGTMELMVAKAGETYSKAMLPGGYHANSGTPGLSAGMPSIKWLDSKPLFHVRVERFSTVRTQDPRVTAFFQNTAASNVRQDVATKAIADLGDSEKVSGAAIFAHLPVTLNKLFALLVDTAETTADAMSVNIVRTMVKIIDRVHDVMNSGAGQNTLLRSYIHHVFRAPASTKQTLRSVHAELAKHLVKELELGSGSTSHDKILRRIWFYMQVMVKSMAQCCAAETTHVTADAISQADRFGATYKGNICELVNAMASAVTARIKEDLPLCKAINSNTAFFIQGTFSLMDRSIGFKLVQLYLRILHRDFEKDNNENLANFKLDFLRIVCEHEHYVPLNLIMLDDVDHVVKPSWVQSTFEKRHVLVGMVLQELKRALHSGAPTLRRQCIAIVCGLLRKHDADDRYSTPEQMSCIAMLYFPLVNLVLDNCRSLYGFPYKTRQTIPHYSIGETRDLLFCFLWVLHNIDYAYVLHWWQFEYASIEIMLDVLALCVQTFKYTGKKYLNTELSSPSKSAQSNLSALEKLYTPGGITTARRSSSSTGLTSASKTGGDRFGRKRSNSDAVSLAGGGGGGGGAGAGSGRQSPPMSPIGSVGGSPTQRPSSSDMAGASSEDPMSVSSPGLLGIPGVGGMLLNDGSGSPPAAGGSSNGGGGGGGTRFSRFQSKSDTVGVAPANIEQLISSMSNLATDLNMVVLGLVDRLMSDQPSLIRNKNSVAHRAISVLFEIHAVGLSVRLAPSWSAVVDAFITHYSDILYQTNEEFCTRLCTLLLHACNSELQDVRNHACTLMYRLLRNNPARVSQELMVAVSKLDLKDHDDDCLRTSLVAIAEFGKHDQNSPSNEFPAEVSRLMERLRRVRLDTAEMEHYGNDHEMLADLQARVADSYSKTPVLRLVWLERLAELHMKNANWSEAGMCVCYCGALIAEHLRAVDGLNAVIPLGSKAFRNISPTLGAVMLDSFENLADGRPLSGNGGAAGAGAGAGSPEPLGGDGVTLTSPLFSERGLLATLPKAVGFFKKAQRYELVSRIYQLFMPIYERDRMYEELALACKDMQECFNKIVKCREQEQSGHQRMLGIYYRVSFHGSLLGDLDGHEYIYKEADGERIAGFLARLKDLHVARFGASKVNMIQESKVDEADLDDKYAHIQVISVEPYLSETEALEKVGAFECNQNLRRFILETPFTKGGKARGSAATQCMEQLIMHVEDGHSFPSVKKRLRVARNETIILEPIDVAIRAMSKKVSELRRVVYAKGPAGRDGPHPDIISLQLQLQGIVSIQVNEGPMEYVNVFLSEDSSDGLDSLKVEELQECFAAMLKLVRHGLLRNEKSIGEDQKAYQNDLEYNAQQMEEKLAPMLAGLASLDDSTSAGGAAAAAAGSGSRSQGAIETLLGNSLLLEARTTTGAPELQFLGRASQPDVLYVPTRGSVA